MLKCFEISCFKKTKEDIEKGHHPISYSEAQKRSQRILQNLDAEGEKEANLVSIRDHVARVRRRLSSVPTTDRIVEDPLLEELSKDMDQEPDQAVDMLGKEGRKKFMRRLSVQVLEQNEGLVNESNLESYFSNLYESQNQTVEMCPSINLSTFRSSTASNRPSIQQRKMSMAFDHPRKSVASSIMTLDDRENMRLENFRRLSQQIFTLPQHDTVGGRDKADFGPKRSDTSFLYVANPMDSISNSTSRVSEKRVEARVINP